MPKSTWRVILFMSDTDQPKLIEDKSTPKKRKWILLVVIGCLLILSLIIFLYWVLSARFYISTEDAYVNGNTVEVYPQIGGNITTVNVQETFHVKQGDVLVILDPTESLIAFENSKSALANTVREVVQKFDQVFKIKAHIQMLQSQLAQAELNFQHRDALVKIGGVTKEDFENSGTNVLVAQASLNEAMEDLRGSEAQIYNTTVATHPLVKEAADKVRSSWINLQRTVVLAPIDGYIAKKSAQVGESADPSVALLSIVPLKDIWVDANFKESQLSHIKLGQSVEMVTSLYGNRVKYKGSVVGISPGTGSAFAILPPQNASGNWIKIVQRVPVRISLDSNQLDKYPLRLGLSLKSIVDIRDESGGTLLPMEATQSLYQTSVFQDQIVGVDEIISQVIQQNINPNLSD